MTKVINTVTITLDTVASHVEVTNPENNDTFYDYLDAYLADLPDDTFDGKDAFSSLFTEEMKGKTFSMSLTNNGSCSIPELNGCTKQQAQLAMAFAYEIM